MKTFSKTSRAIIIAMIAVMFFIVTALAFTACDNGSQQDKDQVINDNDNQQDNDQITKYDATFDASITMGQMGSFSFASVFKNAYVTKSNGKYTLTAIFDKGEVEVMTMKGEIFVDDNPGDPDAVGGVANGTLGVYDANGDLVTDGVVATYSTGDDYGVNKAKEKHYYVKSVSFPVDSLRENYEITLYINSAMMGKQFSKESGYRATIKLDLNSGKVVEEISGLGVDTRGTFTEEEPENPTGPSGSEEETPSTPAPQPVNPVADKYTQYAASLDAVVSMGGNNVNFTENLLDGVYVIEKDGKYEITLIFKVGIVNMPYDNVTTGYITNEEYSVRGGGTATPEFGIYDGEEYVKDGITFTYSTGDDYVSTSSARYYYVKSMTFSVDEFEDEYVLSLCVMTAMGTGMQFPYNSSSGLVNNAELTLDLTDADTVDSIDSLLGVENSGAIVEPGENEYTQYAASLDAVVSMGGNNVNFTENLLDGVYVIEKDGKYEITLIFKVGVVNMPYNNVTTGYITNEEYSVRGGGTATPEFGFYDDETLVKEGIVLTYGVNDDDDSSFNYVKSMTFTVDEFAGSYNLSLCVMTAMGTGMQFPYNSSTGLANAVLTLNLADTETVDSIDSLLGVETLD